MIVISSMLKFVFKLIYYSASKLNEYTEMFVSQVNGFFNMMSEMH